MKPLSTTADLQKRALARAVSPSTPILTQDDSRYTEDDRVGGDPRDTHRVVIACAKWRAKSEIAGLGLASSLSRQASLRAAGVEATKSACVPEPPAGFLRGLWMFCRSADPSFAARG